MKIITSSDFFNNEFRLISLSTTNDFPLRKKKNSKGIEEPNLCDGKPTFRTSLKALKLENSLPIGADDTISISLIETPKNGVKVGEFYRAAGKVWFTPYLSNGRLFYSVVIERIEPVLATPFEVKP